MINLAIGIIFADLFLLGYLVICRIDYWDDLTEFLDKRDQRILKNMRDNKDHKI